MGWDNLLSAALIAALGLMLVSAGIEDARLRTIANWKNAAIAVAAPLWWWANGLAVWPDMALQVALGLSVLAVFCAAFALGWMGGGDVKLLAAVALWLPFGPLLTMLMVTSIVGGVLTLVMMIERAIKRNRGVVEVPYGVAIAVAALLALREPIFNQFP